MIHIQTSNIYLEDKLKELNKGIEERDAHILEMVDSQYDQIQTHSDSKNKGPNKKRKH